MSTMGCMTSGLSLLMYLNIKYKDISSDPKRAAETRYFGVYSIVSSVLSAGLLLLSFWGTLALSASIDPEASNAVLMWIIVALIVVCMVFFLSVYALCGFMGAVYQLRCNRRPISWIALAVFVATLAGTTVGLIFIA